MKNLITKTLSLASLAILLVGCSSQSGEQKSSENKNALRYPSTADLVTKDPTKLNDKPSHQILTQIYEGLVSFNEKNEVVPRLAEKIEKSQDGKTYTFKLRKDVVFHNGKKMNADDVIWSFNRACSKKLSSPTAESFYIDIVGAKEKCNGKAETIAGVEKIDDYTVKVTIKEPRDYFLAKLAYPTGNILPKGNVPETEITKIEHAIGTGPFKLIEHHRNELVLLKRNDKYYAEKPKIDEIRIVIVNDQLTALNQFKQGRYDYMEVPSTELPALRKDPGMNKLLRFTDQATSFFLELNPKQYKPFRNKNVRRAFAMVIDQNYLAKNILNDSADPAKGIVAKGIPGQRENTKCLPYDPKTARELMKKAGYTPEKMPRLDLVVPSKAVGGIKTAETVVVQLRKALGINVSVKQLEWGTYLQKLNNKEIAFRFGGWAADYFDAANFLSDLFMSKSSINRCNYSNKEFDIACKKADALSNIEERKKLYAKAEDLLLQDAAVIPLYYPKNIYLINSRVKGIRFNLGGPMEHTTVILK